MKADTLTIVQYRLTRAKETLEEGHVMLTTGHIHACVNRAYYAAFYAVSALLMSEDVELSKHSAVRSTFDRDWVNRGRIEVRLGKIYRKLFDKRQQADYDDLVALDPIQVGTWLQEAGEIVTAVCQILETNTPSPPP